MTASASRWSPERVRLPEPVVLGGVLLAGLAICLARSPGVMLRPELWAEDGQVWFRSAYEQGWLRPLRTPHTGYFQSFPRVVADLGLLVPLGALPALFMGVAVVVQVLPALVLASARFAAVVPGRAARLAIAGAYLLLPNSQEVNANLTNAQWHLGLLALLVVLASPAQSTAWRILDVAALICSGLTGPFCLALLPVAGALWLVRRHPWTALLGALDLLCVAFQAAALASSPRGHFGPLGAGWRSLGEILGGQVVGGTFLGTSTLGAIEVGSHFLPASALLLLAGALLAGWALWRGPLELRLLNAYAALVLGAALLTPVASIDHPQWQVLAETGGIRYWFLPTFALVLDAAFVLASRSRPLLLAGAALCCCLAAFGIREDFRYPAAPSHDWAAEVARFEASPKGTRFRFEIDPARWHMVLIKR